VLAVDPTVILVLVMGLVAYGALGEPRRASTGLWVIGGGIVFPVVVLSALLVYDRTLIRYPRTAPGGRDVVTANELHVPVGEAVDLVLTTSDVIHSFWVPSLAGMKVDREGVYRGQCAEFCGVQHARMALLVVAMPTAAFETWAARQAAPGVAPASAELGAGLDAFLAHGCSGCHTIQGTAAQGRLGPDLTHVGSRRTLAAATLANHVDTMAAWIADAHRFQAG
jgi:cytochrome c oxidase subunit 2